MLGRRIAARQPPPICLPQLRRALLDEWCNITQDQIDNFILSMPRRFQFMIKCFPSSCPSTSYNNQETLSDLLLVFTACRRRASSSSSIDDKRKSIWAIYFHYRSTDEEPMHYFCPVVASSWGSYQRAKSPENISYKHNSIVPTSVMDAVKPIFTELSSPKLLKKCLGVKTQNSNESFNSMVWKFYPQTLGSSKRIVDVAAKEAVVMYNAGMACRLDIMKNLGCKLGHFSFTYAFQSDNYRIK
ncbi:uncharacterized protein TNCV_382901 [Trichonephila clavipes]|nr:uncharacterized protein TNCV_382901 [Trichonephila clavipes]